MPVTAATGAVVRTPRSSDGTHIYAEAVGNPRNPHVVFVHEATLCASVFDELFEDSRLTDHLFMVSGSCSCRMGRFAHPGRLPPQVRYDLRCHGRSGTARGAQAQSSSLHAADFAAVMGAFGLQRPIVVAWYVAQLRHDIRGAHVQKTSMLTDLSSRTQGLRRCVDVLLGP